MRDVVTGFFFGTGAAADAFNVATRVPGLLRDLFAEGAMSAAFVPTLTRYMHVGGKPAAWRLGSHVINGLLTVTGLIVLLGWIFAEPLVSHFAGAFHKIPGKFELTVSLARVTMPFLLLIAVAAACMGMLNAMRRFFIPAMSPALFNVVFIVCTVVLVPYFRHIGVEPAMALGVAMVLGGVAQIGLQWPALRREGYRHQWILNPKDPGLHEVLMLMGPGAIGVAAAQINLLVNTSLAAAQEGAPSTLNYAFRMMYMPIGIFGVSIATAAIPDMAKHAAAKEYDEMRKTLSWGVRLMLMLSVPATVGLIVLATPIIQLIFERGKFGPASTANVAEALMFYAPGIVGYSVVKLASSSFYSLQNARTPVIVSLITIGVNLALNLWLNSIMGFHGLALGTAIAANVNALLLLTLLSRRIGGVDAGRLLVSLAKILVASVLMGFAAYYAEAGLHHWLHRENLIAHLIRVGGGIGAGLASLSVAAWLLRIEEFDQAMRRVLGRLRG